MHPLPLKLTPGSDLRLSLEELARTQQLSGFVLGVVGNLSRAAFQCPGQPQPTVLEGDLEVITLNGTLSPEGVHLHLSLSDGACQVWGGHLEPGTLVQKGVDLLVGVLEQSQPAADSRTATPAAQPPRLEIAVLPGCPWCARGPAAAAHPGSASHRRHGQRRCRLQPLADPQRHAHLPAGVHRW